MLADTPLPHGFGAALASVDTLSKGSRTVRCLLRLTDLNDLISLKRNAPLTGSCASVSRPRPFGFLYGSGRRGTAWITLKIALLAPIPTASIPSRLCGRLPL